jgi:hypothetical protein
VKVILAMLLVMLAARVEAQEQTMTCALVRQVVRLYGKETAEQYGRKYLTAAQLDKARRCLKWRPRRA